MKIKWKIAANIQGVFPRSEYNRRRNDSSSKSKSRIFSYKGTCHFLGNEALCEKILFLLSAYFLTRNRSFFLLCYDFRNVMYKEDEETRIGGESKGWQDFTSDEVDGRNTVRTKESIDNIPWETEKLQRDWFKPGNVKRKSIDETQRKKKKKRPRKQRR